MAQPNYTEVIRNGLLFGQGAAIQTVCTVFGYKSGRGVPHKACSNQKQKKYAQTHAHSPEGNSGEVGATLEALSTEITETQ